MVQLLSESGASSKNFSLFCDQASASARKATRAGKWLHQICTVLDGRNDQLLSCNHVKRAGALFSLGGRDAAAGGRGRRLARSAAAPLAGRRETGPPRASAARRKNRFSFRARPKREMGLDLSSLPFLGAGYKGIDYYPKPQRPRPTKKLCHPERTSVSRRI